jgi:hypothetical protein
MGSSLVDALSKVGLIDEREKNQILADQAPTIAERESRWNKMVKSGNRDEYRAQLYESSSINEFKDSARKLLMERPEVIGEVVKAAHRFKEKDGGDKLIWLCYQVRDLMSQVAPAKREVFLKRAFRSANSVVEIPA